jgi:hypothetical protein
MRGLRTPLGIVGAVMLVLGSAVVAAAPASAAACKESPDRPVCVADLQLDKKIALQPDGSLVVTAGLECDPGWESSDLTVTVTQGQTQGDGLLLTSVPCDGSFHAVQLAVAPGVGSFQKGNAEMNGQFLVFNLASGDPSAAHAETKGQIRSA